MKIVLPVCEYCNEPFLPAHKTQRFCSNKCRQAAWQKAHKPMKPAEPGPVTVETEGAQARGEPA